MKKLLALVLVLGMASFVSAAITLQSGGASVYPSVVSGASITGIMADAGKAYTVEFTPSEGVTFDITGITFRTTMIPGKTEYSGTTLKLTGGELFSDIPVEGVLFEGLVVNGLGSVSVFDKQNNIQMGSFDVVPEPITMTLLGLGGLVALRRRA